MRLPRRLGRRRRGQSLDAGDDADGLGGAWYELAIDLGPPDDGCLDQAIKVLWELAALRECRGKVTRDPIRYEATDPSLASVEEHFLLEGIALLPDGREVRCGMLVVREEGEDAHDWLDFVMSSDLVEEVDPRRGLDPQAEESLARRRPFDDWLATMALRLHPLVPFQIALIGEEVSGHLRLADLQPADVPNRWIGIVTTWDEATYHPVALL